MIYADTSALIKRYLAEPGSSTFDELFLSRGPMAISRLNFVEIRCALARRRRNGQIDASLETDALKELHADLHDGALVLHAVTDSQLSAAFHLIESLLPLPLRSLDALHLAIARDIAADEFATADKIQADAAAALGLTVHRFY